MNLAAIEDMNRKFPHAELCFVESGGDNLAATFSPELADLTIYVIDVAEGEKIPRKGGPGITRSDLLVINKIDLAPLGDSMADVRLSNRPIHARARVVVSNDYCRCVVSQAISVALSNFYFADCAASFGASEATIFSKRGSPRSGSHIGLNRKSP